MTMRLLLILLGLLILITEADAARWRWPWEVQHRARHHPRQRVKIPPPDCVQINEAVKALEPERLERALRSSTRSQRRIIAACVKRDQW